MAPKRRGRRGKGSSPPADEGDRLGALPDDVLHHVLSFLPSQDAVRTCVLARRWQHLWKSATSLHIVFRDLGNTESVKVVREFVDHLLLLRGGSPIDTCELSLADLEYHDTSRLKLWIRHILMCKVRVLNLDVHVLCGGFGDSICVELVGLTFISDHLKKLQLSNIVLDDKLLDLSCCPALEDLQFDDCDFSYAQNISSLSLKYLSINQLCYFSDYYRTRIYAPNLRSLRLQIGHERTPLLGEMPFLLEACVKLCCYSDRCDSSYSGDCVDEYCSHCHGVDGDTNNCVLLQGLSEARTLALISDVEIFIFRRDLKWCPIFGNLKSLLLNEYWCVPADFSPLAYMLEHSPILEKLYLQLYCKGPKTKVEMRGIPDPTVRSAAISKYLKIVEVSCDVVDDRVLDVFKFLSKLGILTYSFSF